MPITGPILSSLLSRYGFYDQLVPWLCLRATQVARQAAEYIRFLPDLKRLEVLSQRSLTVFKQFECAKESSEAAITSGATPIGVALE